MIQEPASPDPAVGDGGGWSRRPAPHDPRRSPGVWLPPPFVFAAGLALGLAAHRLHPAALVPAGSTRLAVAFEAIAGILILAACGLLGWGVATLWRARTSILPHRGATALALRGPYRFSRNPMYLGLTMLYLGLTALAGSGWPLVFLPFVLVAIDRWVIRREEGHLRLRFGTAYDGYRARVRRWI